MMTAILLSLVSCSNNKNGMGPDGEESGDTTGTHMLSWITTPDATKLLERQPAVPFSSSTGNFPLITVDTSKTFQTIDGAGYTLTGGSAYLINQMPAAAKANLLEELFGNNENSLHISFLRISIGSSDLDSTIFTYDDMPASETDTSLSNFSLDRDQSDLIPLLKQIIEYNPSIKLLATPWTAPSWMKDNNNSKGGSLRPEYFDAYAKYFFRYIRDMETEGVHIYAITPQNEPLNPDNNPSMLMTADDQAAFIKNNLGPAFAAGGILTKIIVYDHNCDRPDYPLSIINDEGAKPFIDGSAFHLYAGDITALSQVHNAHPDKNVYFTEQYTASTGTFSGDLQWHVKNIVIGATRNWSRSVFEWNLANDPSYGPHTPGGCTTCKGALTIDGANVTRNVAYYIIAHFSAFITPASVRVMSSSVSQLQNVAFRTPAGNIVVIVYNEGSGAASFNIKVGAHSGTGSLPAGAVGTFAIE
jgi:glucosylceramidase